VSAEPFDQPDSGYPEEGPPGAAPDDAGDEESSSVRERSYADPDGSEAEPGDDGKATGNPNT